MIDDTKSERRDETESEQPATGTASLPSPIGKEAAIETDAAEQPGMGSQLPTPDEIRLQRDDYRELLLRQTAEFDNYRKRIERERAEVSQAAAIDLIEELLPLIDDLERALEIGADTEAAAYRAGVELIHTQLLEVLGKRGVTPIETTGEDFDPRVHEALTHEVSPEHRGGAVIDELRRGYTVGGRLLRPALVKVAKA